MKLELQLRGLDGVLEMLKQLPPEVVSKRGGPVKTALRKGAVVILKQARANLQVVTANATASEKIESTGLLLKNLVATRGKPPPGENGERYLVRVRRKGYPRKGGSSVSTQKTGLWLEYGTSEQPAEPWLRPAAASKAEDAIRTIESELVRGLDRVVAKLAAQNKGR